MTDQASPRAAPQEAVKADTADTNGDGDQKQSAKLLRVENIGFLTFFFSAITIMILVTIALLSEDSESAGTLRLIEPVLALAGASLVIVFISPNTRNAFVVVFGILLIGALIVPTTDLIRFALIVSGSERNFQDFFVQSQGGKSQLVRDLDVAQKIINELDRAAVLPTAIDNVKRNAAAAAISRVLVQERNQQILDRVRQRGALPILKRIADNTHDDWFFRFSSNERFNDDLNFLRTEGLIEFSYDDIETIRATELAFQVIRNERTPSPLAELPDLPFSSILFGPELEVPEDLSTINVIVENQMTNYLTPEIGDAYSWFRFTTSDAGVFQIDVRAVGTSLDGLAVLLDADEPNTHSPLAQSDDAQGSFDPQIITQLGGNKEYLLAIRNLTQESGQFRVSIAQRDTAAR